MEGEDAIQPATIHGLGRAMAELLLGSRTAAAFDVCHVVNDAARLLGADQVDLYLVDYSQRYLRPLGPDSDDEIAIEGTIAGQVFTTGRPASDEGPGVWWPLIDGTDRLGVAHVVDGSGADGPPAEWAEWLEPFAALVSEVLVSKNQYSDFYRRRRRRHPLSLSAEQQWRQLPPLTFTRPTFVVAGALEPAYHMGGDAFDYGHDRTGLRFEITDAMGHGVEAMLLSTAATAALRHARTENGPLEEAYRAADGILREHFGESRFVTGLLGHLDPGTHTLTWLNAGHPLPLLVRDGRLEGTLDCRPSLPMGLGGAVIQVARRRLEPGDRVLFYTDGVTDARREDEAFGIERLGRNLERATAEGLDAPETIRQVSLAVLAHANDELSDDSSLLLIEMRDPGR